MTDYDNTNRGAIFANTRKETDKHPDRTGSINVDGKDYWISGWLKVSAKGQKFLSLAVTLKEGQPQPRGDGTDNLPAQQPEDNFDDDIPF